MFGANRAPPSAPSSRNTTVLRRRFETLRVRAARADLCPIIASSLRTRTGKPNRVRRSCVHIVGSGRRRRHTDGIINLHFYCAWLWHGMYAARKHAYTYTPRVYKHKVCGFSSECVCVCAMHRSMEPPHVHDVVSARTRVCARLKNRYVVQRNHRVPLARSAPTTVAEPLAKC